MVSVNRPTSIHRLRLQGNDQPLKKNLFHRPAVWHHFDSPPRAVEWLPCRWKRAKTGPGGVGKPLGAKLFDKTNRPRLKSIQIIIIRAACNAPPIYAKRVIGSVFGVMQLFFLCTFSPLRSECKLETFILDSRVKPTSLAKIWRAENQLV